MLVCVCVSCACTYPVIVSAIESTCNISMQEYINQTSSSTLVSWFPMTTTQLEFLNVLVCLSTLKNIMCRDAIKYFRAT